MIRPSARFFNSTCNVVRPTKSFDALGAPTLTFNEGAPIFMDLPASVQPASSSVRFMYAQRQLEVDHEVFFQSVVALQRGDRLDTSSGRKLIVDGWRDEADRGIVFVVDCHEVLP